MIGVLWAAAVLLGSAGWAKVIRPAPAADSVRAARLPAGGLLALPIMIRAIGLVEILVAATVLVLGGTVAAALLAISYLLLTFVAGRMFRTAPGTDCGCFSRTTAPIGRWHLIVNVGAFLVASFAVVWPSPGVLAEFESEGWATLPVLVLAIVLAWLCQLLMTALPALLALRTKVAAAQ